MEMQCAPDAQVGDRLKSTIDARGNAARASPVALFLPAFVVALCWQSPGARLFHPLR